MRRVGGLAGAGQGRLGGGARAAALFAPRIVPSAATLRTPAALGHAPQGPPLRGGAPPCSLHSPPALLGLVSSGRPPLGHASLPPGHSSSPEAIYTSGSLWPSGACHPPRHALMLPPPTPQPLLGLGPLPHAPPKGVGLTLKSSSTLYTGGFLRKEPPRRPRPLLRGGGPPWAPSSAERLVSSPLGSGPAWAPSAFSGYSRPMAPHPGASAPWAGGLRPRTHWGRPLSP